MKPRRQHAMYSEKHTTYTATPKSAIAPHAASRKAHRRAHRPQHYASATKHAGRIRHGRTVKPATTTGNTDQHCPTTNTLTIVLPGEGAVRRDAHHQLSTQEKQPVPPFPVGCQSPMRVWNASSSQKRNRNGFVKQLNCSCL